MPPKRCTSERSLGGVGGEGGVPKLNSEISTKLQSDQNHAAHNQNMPQFTMLLISSLGPKYFLVETDHSKKNCLDIFI